MGFDNPAKRRRLVGWFGEEYVANLERHIKALNERLMREGVSYKEFHAEMDACTDGICTGQRQQDLAVLAPANPYAGATTWADLNAAQELAAVELEIAHLWDVLMGVASNIRTSDEPLPAKAKLLKDAVAEFVKRVGQVKGAKAISGLQVEIAQAIDEFDQAAAKAGDDLAALRVAVQALIEGLHKSTGSKGLNRDPVAAAILTDLRSLGPHPLGTKEKGVAEEFAQALEDDPAGVYLSDLARYGAVKE